MRKKYKTLIQKNHPDRFPENSPEQKVAEQRIRLYNAAYKLIADYYQTNNNLPRAIKHKTKTKNKTKTKKKPPSQRPPTNIHTHTKKETAIKKSKRKTIITLSLLVGTAVLFQNYLTPEQKQVNTPKPITPDKLKYRSYQPETKEHLIGGNSGNQNYFTIGASIGEVILIQGEPSYISEDTWYYGLSSITFTNGVVSDWIRHPENPLHIKRRPPPSFELAPSTSHKQPLTDTKKPYWER